jgi:hypothetical protein
MTACRHTAALGASFYTETVTRAGAADMLAAALDLCRRATAASPF